MAPRKNNKRSTDAKEPVTLAHEETQDLQVIVVTVAVQPPVKLLYVLFIYILYDLVMQLQTRKMKLPFLSLQGW